MRQVLITLCVVCRDGSLNCYDSEREPKKIYCSSCTEKRCPTPTERFSHGFCDEHFQGELQRIKMRREKYESNV